MECEEESITKARTGGIFEKAFKNRKTEIHCMICISMYKSVVMQNLLPPDPSHDILEKHNPK